MKSMIWRTARYKDTKRSMCDGKVSWKTEKKRKCGMKQLKKIQGGKL
jgi:hypothetical protein